MKSVSVNPKYQSRFMPILERLETEIKLLILLCFLRLGSEYELRLRIRKTVEERTKELEMPDKQAYVNGLLSSANRMVFSFYREPAAYFKANSEGFGTPLQLMKYEAKGSVRVKDYAKALRKKMYELAQTPVTTDEIGKKPISLWQKAELDLRYEHNMSEINRQIAEGIDLCWLSSHPDCSKRCQKWQGKLVSLTERSRYSGFRVRTVDGHWVYSLPDIMAQTDKYGYRNNIISGFNCRHHTIPYRGQLPPTEYTAEEVKRQRKVESDIREMERAIRKTRKYALFLREAGDRKGYGIQKAKADGMVAEYKAYCEKNGYAWEKYRIEV